MLDPHVAATVACGPGDLAPWLRLQRVPGLGPAGARKLLRRFGLPQQLFAASPRQLADAQLSPALIAALLAPPDESFLAQLALTERWLACPRRYVFTLADGGYPHALLDLADPPLLLYAEGDASLLQARSLAMVGSRNATVQGVRDAQHFSNKLCGAGWTIVSGLALGIDAAAHRGALASGAPAATVAVIGTGCDVVYPARHAALAQEIAARGCLVSEYALGTPALAANFPRRNRLIAGLSRAVLVVEAAVRSGSLITARLAAEQGRDVFAMPGSIHAPLAGGCHKLIQQGAALVVTPDEVLDALTFGSVTPTVSNETSPPCKVPIETDAVAAKLLPLLDFGPTAFDTLAVQSGMPAGELGSALLALEMAGQAERLPGGAYRKLSIG
ncbi:MAG TPA: DNA-processing protein DprA [Burkholderiaceae bacterium]